MISNRTLDKIRSELLDYGGECKGVFDTRDIEELFRSYENLFVEYNLLLEEHNEQRRLSRQYAYEEQERVRRAHEREMSRMR